MTVAHAARVLLRDARAHTRVRWVQDGFRRARGAAALTGLPRTLLVAGAGAVLGAIAGTLTANGLGGLLGHAPVAAVLAGLAAGTAAVLVGAAVVAAGDRATLAHVRALR